MNIDDYWHLVKKVKSVRAVRPPSRPCIKVTFESGYGMAAQSVSIKPNNTLDDYDIVMNPCSREPDWDEKRMARAALVAAAYSQYDVREYLLEDETLLNRADDEYPLSFDPPEHHIKIEL